MSDPIRVLVVDDSSLIRSILSDALNGHPDITVIAEAGDGLKALALTRSLRPDVVTMDVMMPMMDGMEAIEAIMREVPTPVVVVAASDSADFLAMRALASGATHVFPKPTGGFGQASAKQLASTVRRAAAVDVTGWHPTPATRLPSGVNRGPRRRGQLLIGVVGSTGGPRQLEEILATLPPDFAHIMLIVQHTAAGFSQALASWLDDICPVPVALAVEGARLKPGTVVVAPDNVHLRVRSDRTIELQPTGRVDGHRPSGSVLLESLAQFGENTVGVVLTGMGQDGARGLEQLVLGGGTSIVEDPATATVAGMPRAALARVPHAFVAVSGGVGRAIMKLTRG